MNEGHVPGCTGKKAFVCFTKAQARAKVLNRKKDSAHVEAYHCRHCQQIHLGERRSYGRRDARKDEGND